MAHHLFAQADESAARFGVEQRHMGKRQRRQPGANQVAEQHHTHRRSRISRLRGVGLCMIGNTAVTVFSVNNCWRAMMTMMKPKV